MNHQDELRKELGQRIKDVQTKVIAGLREAGHEVETVECRTFVGGADGQTIFKVDGIRMDMALTAQKSGGGGWSTHYNGKLPMRIGQYPDTKSYPESKAGFDIAKTVERIQEAVAAKKRKDEAEAKRQAKVQETRGLAEQVQEACDMFLGKGIATVSATRPGSYRHSRPEMARDLPAVTIEMDVLEAQCVATLLASMRKGKNAVTEAEAYGDEDGTAGAESGVEHEEI